MWTASEQFPGTGLRGRFVGDEGTYTITGTIADGLNPLNKSQKLVAISKIAIGVSKPPQVNDSVEVGENIENQSTRHAKYRRDHSEGSPCARI